LGSFFFGCFFEMMAVAEGKQQRFDDKGGKIDVLGDEILSHVLERLPDRLDRLSWCLVCKRFLSVEASCRQYIHLLRPEILSKVLQRYSQVKNLDLSSCIQITNESLETVARLAGKRLLSLKLIRVRGFTCAGLEAIGRGCSSLQEVDLTNCLHVGDATLAGLAQLKNLQSLKIPGCRNVTDTGLGFIAASCKQLKLLNLKWCLGIRDAGIMAIASNCKELHTLDLSYTEVCASLLRFPLTSLL
jgi:F-box/leucine-rich repeat protein 2/20